MAGGGDDARLAGLIPRLSAQFLRELVFGAAARADRRVDDHMLARPHFGCDHRGAIAADVVGLAISPEERFDRLRRLLAVATGRRAGDFQRNDRHLKGYLAKVWSR